MSNLHRIIFLLIFVLSPISSPALAAEGDVFEGVYFGVRLGAIFPHSADESFMSSNADDADQDGLVLVERNAADEGFGFNVAFGARLDLGLAVWMRSEMELGWQRYAVRQTRDGSGGGKGDVRTFSFLWQNYFHPLAKHNPHQIWGGLGLGGSFVDTQLQNGSGIAESGGINFVAMLSGGYDYLILERSRFSGEYLLMGVSYRFVFAEGVRQELGSQLMVNLTYGF